jgi:antitoxin ParD1/3/4
MDGWPTRNINLTEHLDRFIQTEVESGRYSKATEVVREGLHLMERSKREERAKLKWLRSAVREGLDQLNRCEAREFSSIGELEEDIDQLG